MDGIVVLFGLYSIGLGLVGIVAPQLLFKLRHPISVTEESQLSDAGVLFYRMGGVVSIIIGFLIMGSF